MAEIIRRVVAPQRVSISIAAATTTVVIAGTSGEVIHILGLFLYNGNTAGNVTLRDSTPTVIDGVLQFPANFGFLWTRRDDPWVSLASGTGFEIVTSGAGQLSGHVFYTKG